MGSSQRFCIWCGSELRQGGRFCTTCGRAAADAGQAAPLVAEEQMPIAAREMVAAPEAAAPTEAVASPEAVAPTEVFAPHQVIAAPEVAETRPIAAESGPTGISPPAPIGDRIPETAFDRLAPPTHPGGPGGSAPDRDASPQQPWRRRSRWPVVLSLIALLCVAGAASVIFILHPFRGSRPASITSQERSPLASPASSPSTSPLSASSAGASQQASPVTSTTLPAAVGVVDIGGGVTNDSQAQSVAGIFNTYFSGINHHHYWHAVSVFDPASPLDTGNSLVSSLARQDATTTDSNIILTGLHPSGNGLNTVAALTFQSRQAPGYGPSGSPDQTCTTWHLRYTLTQPSGSYLISKVNGTHTRC